jgi:hypothetical protein
LQTWWANVDGAGTSMDDYLRATLGKALAAGHCGILSDKDRVEAAGPSRAEERGRVFLTRYRPRQIPDWRLNQDDTIAAVKLWQPVPSLDLLTPETNERRALLWGDTQWLRVPKDNTEPIEQVRHGLGLVPFVVVRPQRSEGARHGDGLHDQREPQAFGS